MTIQHNIYRASRWLAYKLPTKVKGLLASEIVPTKTLRTPHGPVRFYGFGRLPMSRIENAYIRQGAIFKWVDTFLPESVFWDIGANHGTISLYAAANPHIKVISVEPLASNFWLLNKNIFINRFTTITAYPIALSETNNFGKLGSSHNPTPGVAGSSFGRYHNDRNEYFTPVFEQGTVGFTGDSLVYSHGIAMPNYLKIDVDGTENHVLEGMTRVLQSSELKSIVLETSDDRGDHAECVAILETAGFGKRYNMPDTANWMFERCGV